MSSQADTRTEEQSAQAQLSVVPRSGAWLLLERGGSLTSVPLRAGRPIVIGRRAPSDLVLDDPEVSGEHVRVELDGASVRLIDLGSKNAIRVGTTKVRETTLFDGDEATIGATLLRAHVPTVSTRASERSVGYGVFVQELQRELERARCFRRQLAVLAVRHVSPAGEMDLLLAPLLRAVDVIGRYSDDISLVLAPEVDLEAGRTLGARVSAALESAYVALAVYPTHGASGHELLDITLARLRSAQGGDRVVLPDNERHTHSAQTVIHAPRMQRLYQTLDRVARVTMPVLILGETGVGKELIARALHTHGPRAAGPFKAVNCGAIPSGLLESELFGHERGAFTGAERTRLGVFEQAQQGTIFLDEIGELDDRAQAALLRVLESRCITRVGGVREFEVDVRVVAATHRDLEAMTERGTFRKDLWYRLDAMTLHVPPLRERSEEIAPLCEHFLREFGPTGRVRVHHIQPHALEALRAYAWPGNVRQLRNVIERACAIAESSEIGLDELPDNIVETTRSSARAAAASEHQTLDERLMSFERGILDAALKEASGNQTQAARALGIPRRTLAYRMRVLGFRVPAEIKPGSD